MFHVGYENLIVSDVCHCHSDIWPSLYAFDKCNQYTVKTKILRVYSHLRKAVVAGFHHLNALDIRQQVIESQARGNFSDP